VYDRKYIDQTQGGVGGVSAIRNAHGHRKIRGKRNGLQVHSLEPGLHSRVSIRFSIQLSYISNIKPIQLSSEISEDETVPVLKAPCQ
jgi:hypothetical protein